MSIRIASAHAQVTVAKDGSIMNELTKKLSHQNTAKFSFPRKNFRTQKGQFGKVSP